MPPALDRDVPAAAARRPHLVDQRLLASQSIDVDADAGALAAGQSDHRRHPTLPRCRRPVRD